MANDALKGFIQTYIRQNGNEEITGPVLQNVLLQMVNTLGAGYQFVGVATPSTNPGTPTSQVFYIGGAGTYSNFGNSAVEVPAGSVVCFYYDSSWHNSVVRTDSNGFININSLVNHPSAYANRAAAIANIPTALRNTGIVATYLTSTEWVTEQFVGSEWGPEDTKWRSIGEPEKELADTEESGFFVTDAILNILIQYTSAGFDVAKISDHFKQLINESVSNGAIADVEEKGFFVVDQMLNIGFKVDENGAHAKNILEYEIIND